MTEQPPPEVTPPPERPNRHQPIPEPDVMPKWVPVLIGVVLVTLAALAVMTGLRYRDNTLVRMVRGNRPARPPVNAPAPPGEPEPGASLVYSGSAGDQVPGANTPPPGNARAEIAGGAGGVEAIMRTRTRRGMVVKAEPPDAMIFVNDMPIGQASQFDSDDEVYEFAQPGSYTVRIIAPGHRDKVFLVTAAEDAATDVAHLQAKLEKQ